MKTLFSLIFLLLINPCWGQHDSLTIYKWESLSSNVNSDTVYAISFRKMKLDSLPIELSKYHNLIYLDLEKNKLSKLPSYISDFKHLEVLKVSSNKLYGFPLPLCKMPQLKKLFISRNDISSIPNCIEYMKELQYIDLYDNPIRSLPESITKLKNLSEIDLSGIKFSPAFQESWIKKLPNTTFKFDPPCDCMN